MPISKSQQIRIIYLDRLLGGRRRYGREQLLEVLNEELVHEGHEPISLRQLQKDLDMMRSESAGYNAPLVYSRADKCYFYSEEGYSIFKTPVGREDLLVLHQASRLLQQFKGLQFSQEISDIAHKLERSARIAAQEPANAIAFEQTDLKGMELLHTLHAHILNKEAIDVAYKPYTEDVFTCDAHPYFLKQFNQRWFLFAYSEARGRLMNFAIDRIQGISPSHLPFRPNAEIDFSTYFDDIIGVTHLENQALQEVYLRFTKWRAPYVESKPMHASQQAIGRDGEYTIFKLSVIPNRELVSLILAFGSDVEVLAPLSLREDVAKEVKKTWAYYV